MMQDNATTRADQEFLWLEDGERVYPCRCGETHQGEWAMYVYYHHNCLHEEDLVSLGTVVPGEIQAICPSCGQTWIVTGIGQER